MTGGEHVCVCVFGRESRRIEAGQKLKEIILNSCVELPERDDAPILHFAAVYVLHRPEWSLIDTQSVRKVDCALSKFKFKNVQHGGYTAR